MACQVEEPLGIFSPERIKRQAATNQSLNQQKLFRHVGLGYGPLIIWAGAAADCYNHTQPSLKTEHTIRPVNWLLNRKQWVVTRHEVSRRFKDQTQSKVRLSCQQVMWYVCKDKRFQILSTAPSAWSGSCTVHNVYPSTTSHKQLSKYPSSFEHVVSFNILCLGYKQLFNKPFHTNALHLKITTPHIMAREFGKSFHRNWISNQRGHGQVASWTPWQRGQMKRIGQDWQMTREWAVTCLKVWQSRAVWYCLAQDIYNDVIMMSSQAFTF